MLILDGSYGEGGGQILRTALVLSLLTDQPFRIEKIRAGRPQPGLKPQHLHILKALLKMSDSQAEGVQQGSLTVSFQPGRVKGGNYNFEIGTAGAIPLFLQTLLPVAFFANGNLSFKVTGGTDVIGAMTMDFWQEVLLPFLQPYARKVTLEVTKRGYYPAGGGQVKLTVTPIFSQADWQNRRSEAPALTIPERGRLTGIRVLSRCSEDLKERSVAQRQSVACNQLLGGQLFKMQNRAEPALSTGSSITAIADYEQTRLGVDGLGERDKSAEKVGQEAAQRLKVEMDSPATVDLHTADNLMLWVALFGGAYSFSQPTGHITTNAWTIEQFLPGAFRVEDGWVRSS